MYSTLASDAQDAVSKVEKCVDFCPDGFAPDGGFGRSPISIRTPDPAYYIEITIF
jgi:hypothetical protein